MSGCAPPSSLHVPAAVEKQRTTLQRRVAASLVEAGRVDAERDCLRNLVGGDAHRLRSEGKREIAAVQGKVVQAKLDNAHRWKPKKLLLHEIAPHGRDAFPNR